MKSFILLVFIAFVGMDGCNSSKSMAKINEIKWVLQTLNGKEVKLSDPNSNMFIQFDVVEKRVDGRAACNRFFGNYEMDGNSLKFSPMGATRMACPDLQIETEFFQTLDKVDAFTIKDNLLSFESKGVVIATFKKGEDKEVKN